MLDFDDIFFQDWAVSNRAGIHEFVTSLSASYTMDEASQISISISDPDFKMLKDNYFQIRRQIEYRDKFYEVASIEVTTSDDSTPLVNIEARPQMVQEMKRDKTAESFRDISASDYARIIADRYNLNLLVENTAKKQTIVKGKSAKADESAWALLQRLAGELQFICFESDGWLFFCSEKYLLGKIGSLDTWQTGTLSLGIPDYPGTPLKLGSTGNAVGNIQDALIEIGYSINNGASGNFDATTKTAVIAFQKKNKLVGDGVVNANTWTKLFKLSDIGKEGNYIPIIWPPTGSDQYPLLSQPVLRRSDDNPMEGDGVIVVDRETGVNLRPAQTIGLIGIPDFEGLYLITEVRFDQASPGPVEVSFRTPVKPEKKAVAK